MLVHGTGSSLHAWEGWAQALKDKRRVIRFDLPGFGLTGPSPDGVYSSDNDIGVLIAILDKLRVDRCVLGGASLGGGIAWRAALAHPSRVEKIILVDAGGYPTKPISQPIGFRLASIPGMDWLLENILPRYLVEQGFRDVWGDPNKVTPEMVERSIELTQREGNRRALLDRFHQYSGSGSLAHRIPELKLPTLIIWGGRDRLIPPENARRFHRRYSGQQLSDLRGFGARPRGRRPGADGRSGKAISRQVSRLSRPTQGDGKDGPAHRRFARVSPHRALPYYGLCRHSQKTCDISFRRLGSSRFLLLKLRYRKAS